MVKETKNALRQLLLEESSHGSAVLHPEAFGKAAERIRRIPAYRAAQTIMASPVYSVRQVRLNALSDHKRLVQPTPGLQKGFVILDPKSIPFGKRSFAIQVQPGNPFAAKIPYDVPLRPPITLIVTGALAVGLDGSRLGDGHGYLDIQYAILKALGWLGTAVQLIAVIEENHIRAALPMEPTDVGVHWIATPERIIETPYRVPSDPEIVWKNFTEKQIRRNDALFHLHRRASVKAPRV